MGTPVTIKANQVNEAHDVSDDEVLAYFTQLANGEKDFTGGEISQLPESLTTVVDPAIAAEIFLEHRAASTKAGVESTVAFSKGMAAFKDDRPKLQEFLERLAKAKVLSSEEVAAGLDENKSKSFASKFNKISAYSDIILDERVISLLNPGYSVLYELALLIEELEKTVEEGKTLFEILLDVMQTRNGPISRGWLKQERAKLKPPRVDAPSIVPEPDAPVVDEPPVSDRQEDVSEASQEAAEDMEAEDQTPASDGGLAEVVLGQERPPIVAVVMTADGDSMSRLAKAIAGDRTPVCVKVSDQVADRAALIVYGKVGLLLSMASIVQRYGFSSCERLYLMAQPAEPNVIEQTAVAVYVRGGFQVNPDVVGWPEAASPLDWASSLLSGIDGRRVHVFAESKSFEWESIVGEENWQIEP